MKTLQPLSEKLYATNGTDLQVLGKAQLTKHIGSHVLELPFIYSQK